MAELAAANSKFLVHYSILFAHSPSVPLPPCSSAPALHTIHLTSNPGYGIIHTKLIELGYRSLRFAHGEQYPEVIITTKLQNSSREMALAYLTGTALPPKVEAKPRSRFIGNPYSFFCPPSSALCGNQIRVNPRQSVSKNCSPEPKGMTVFRKTNPILKTKETTQLLMPQSFTPIFHPAQLEKTNPNKANSPAPERDTTDVASRGRLVYNVLSESKGFSTAPL